MENLFEAIDWSANWLEYYVGLKEERIDLVRGDMSKNLTLRRSGRIAELNVGLTCNHVQEKTDETIHFVEKSETFNLSHCEVRGTPADCNQLYKVAVQIAHSVIQLHEAVVAVPPP